MDIIDFDEITVDFDEEEDDTLPFEPLKPIPEPVLPTGTVSVPPPLSRAMASPFPLRGALELTDNADKLFDFSGTKLTAQQQIYIISYAVRGTKLGATKLAGVPMSLVSAWEQDEEFMSALNCAVVAVGDALEEELLRRAMNGSDRLLLEANRAHKPEKYSRKETKNVNVNGTVVHTWSDLAMQAQKSAEALEEVKSLPENPVIDVEFDDVIIANPEPVEVETSIEEVLYLGKDNK